MTLDIFESIGNGVKGFFDDFGRMIENNYENPIFWILLLIVLLGLAYFAISALNNK